MTKTTKTTNEVQEPNADVTGDSMEALFGTDKSAETAGIVLNYGKFGKIKVARAGGANTRFAKALESAMRPYRGRMETLDEGTAEDALLTAFAESVVLGWEGIKLNGKLLAFSRENVIVLFKALPELFRDVREQAMNFSNFRNEQIENDSGN